MKKTVLITGTSSGFGKATARHFAREGWNVVATMRRPEEEKELTQLPGVLVTRLDVQDRGSITTAIEAGIARFGRIDALVNNAGFGLFGLFEATPREKIAEQFDVNVFGVMDVTRAILPHFRQNKSGVILNIGSGAGVFTLPMLSLYCASKFALEGFTEALSYELASQNIIVKMIEPGGVVSTNFGKRSGASPRKMPRCQTTTPLSRTPTPSSPACVLLDSPRRKESRKLFTGQPPTARNNCATWLRKTSSHW